MAGHRGARRRRASPPQPRDGARPDVHAGDRGRGRHPGGACRRSTLEAVQPLLDRLAASCLPAGPTSTPAAYGGRRHPELGPTEPELDLFELAAGPPPDERGLPILAICRGAQALNVARGGTLHQHLPDRAGPRSSTARGGPGAQRHPRRSRSQPGSLAHRVIAAPAGAGELLPPPGGRQSSARAAGRAWAPDGVIEAIEAPEPPVPARRPVARGDA